MNAEHSAIRSPNRCPVPIEPPTMIATPTIIRASAASVTGRGLSFRKSHDSKAENVVVKARMKTRLAVEVLKTPVMKVIEPKP